MQEGRRKVKVESAGELLAMLESTIDAITEGIIITDVQGKIIYYNSALEMMEGLQGRNVVGRYLTEVYRVTPEMSEHLRVVKNGKPIKNLAKQYFTAEGRKISILASTYPIYRKGKIVGAFSVCRDVTKLKDLLNENILLQKQVYSNRKKESSRMNGTRYTFDDFVYTSKTIEKIVFQAKKVALSDCAVLVCGETGTGKEIIVQSIHNASSRQFAPFVGINCAAIPDTLMESLLFGTVKGAFTSAVNSTGLIEQAGEGTLFLDEINSMSMSLQAKLLRVLQEKTFRRLGAGKEIPVKCRIIASTNMDPWECIKKGTLREDLYYRLAVFVIYIPPLRERPEDIEVLINHFLNRYSKIYGHTAISLEDSLREGFMQYTWPGNVRELKHIIESCLAMLEPGEYLLTSNHLPFYVRSKFVKQETGISLNYSKSKHTIHQILKDVERQVIEKALRENQSNITRTASSLGILRQNLQYRMKKLGIKTDAVK